MVMTGDMKIGAESVADRLIGLSITSGGLSNLYSLLLKYAGSSDTLCFSQIGGIQLFCNTLSHNEDSIN